MIYRSIHIGLMRWLAVICLAFSLVGCRDEIRQPGSQTVADGDSFAVTGSLAVRDMSIITGRGAQAVQPNDGLFLTVFEFDLGDGPENSFLTNIYSAELKGLTGVANNATVEFKLTLKSSVTPKVLHFMLADKPLTATHGSVASILSTLSVGAQSEGDDWGDWDNWGTDMTADGESDNDYRENPEAYWGYVEFPNGYVKTGSDGKPLLNDDGEMIVRDDIKTSLTNIPLIRNFARITVSKNPDVTNFVLTGFEIVNAPTMGTIAPWDPAQQKVPELLSGGQMKNYSQLDYAGIVAGDAGFGKLKGADNGDGTFSSFIYEHPYEPTRRSYLIVSGSFTWTDEQGTHTQVGYYKLDIGNNNQNNHKIFEHYNIIRNIHYKVKITKVEAKGYASFEEAVNNAPFNNISAATETASMLSISDGHNLLILNNLNYVIVEPNQRIMVLYQYMKGVENSTNKEQDNSVPEVVGLTYPGPVVKDIRTNTDTVIDGTSWVKYELFINNPTSDVKTQSFSIVDNNGLGRTVNLTLRLPWRYSPVCTAGGTTYYATVAKGDKSLYGEQLQPPVPISPMQGEDFTVYFNLPDGLPATMFPLVFQLESKTQAIENNKVGNLVVNSGASLFDPDVTAISYLKTVTYEEYTYKYKAGSNELDNTAYNEDHTIRCRFRTILNSESPDEVIRIYNPYFQNRSGSNSKYLDVEVEFEAPEML